MSYSRTVDDTGTLAVRQHSTSCTISHARAVASETLSDLAAVQHKLSVHAEDIRLKPDYWLGLLQGVTAYLLVALEEEDA